MFNIEEQVSIPSIVGTAVQAVREDAPAIVAAVKTNVQRSQAEANSCMMGGWTSN